jgi:hypothetical protein
LSGRSLCDELITRPEESYRLWCVVVCDLENKKIRRKWPAMGQREKKKKKTLNCSDYIASMDSSNMCWWYPFGNWRTGFFFNPMSPHVLMDFVVFPPGHDSSVTDFWGWDTHEAQLRCPDDANGDIGSWCARRALKPKFY